jgi:uncharacterized membrane protein
MSPDLVLALSALGIGIVAGLRSLTAPAAVSWAAYLHGAFGGFHVERLLVKHMKVTDTAIAFAEDALAIGAGLFFVFRF